MAHILVVDDDDGYREFTADSLEMVGHTVTQAANGHKALEILRSRAFDVLITDLRMPGMDGMTLLRRVRRELPTLTVVILSAYAAPASIAEAARLGAFECLLKPLPSPDVLRQLIPRALEAQAGTNAASPDVDSDDSAASGPELPAVRTAD